MEVILKRVIMILIAIWTWTVTVMIVMLKKSMRSVRQNREKSRREKSMSSVRLKGEKSRRVKSNRSVRLKGEKSRRVKSMSVRQNGEKSRRQESMRQKEGKSMRYMRAWEQIWRSVTIAVARRRTLCKLDVLLLWREKVLWSFSHFY